MLKVLLYGLASFLETGIGIWFFGEMFPKRKVLEKENYWSVGIIYGYMIITSIAFIDLYVHIQMKSIDMIIFLTIAVAGILLSLRYHKTGLTFGWIWLLLLCQYWDSYLSVPLIIMGGIYLTLYLFSFFECDLFAAYLWSTLYLLNIGVTKVLYMTILGTMRSKYYKEYFIYPRTHTYGEVLYWIFVCLLLYYILHYNFMKRAIKELVLKRRKVLFIANFTIWGIMRLVINFGEGKIKQNDIMSASMLFGIVIIISSSFFLAIYGKLVETEKQILRVRNEVVEAQYKELSIAYEKNKCLIHDEKHMVSYVLECLANDNVQEAINFLEKSKNIMMLQEGYSWTGISSLDYMLNIKYKKMKDENIDFLCEIEAENIPFSNADFVIIMGNLLDNAIEASRKCKEGERRIKVHIRNFNNIFILKIKNTCIKSAVADNKKFITDKKEKMNHGWGIESVKQIVKRYNGDVSFVYDKTNFEVRITIYELEDINDV